MCGCIIVMLLFTALLAFFANFFYGPEVAALVIVVFLILVTFLVLAGALTKR